MDSWASLLFWICAMSAAVAYGEEYIEPYLRAARSIELLGGYGDYLLAIAGLPVVIYIINSVFFWFIETQMWEQVKQFKIQPKRRVPPEAYWQALPQVLFNNFVVGLGMALAAVLVGFPITVPRPPFAEMFPSGGNATSAALDASTGYSPAWPTGSEVLINVVICVLVVEFGFYYGHRFLHQPGWYKLHKLHHTWKAPVAYTATFCTWQEHILANVTPVLMGPILAGAHPVVTTLWVSFSLFTTTCDHSGYIFTPCLHARPHDGHHELSNQNFGVIGLLDWIHGTDQRFRKREAQRRAESRGDRVVPGAASTTRKRARSTAGRN